MSEISQGEALAFGLVQNGLRLQEALEHLRTTCLFAVGGIFAGSERLHRDSGRYESRLNVGLVGLAHSVQCIRVNFLYLFHALKLVGER
jgi:hypothetical protein